jgi:hypothetical protein
MKFKAIFWTFASYARSQESVSFIPGALGLQANRIPAVEQPYGESNPAVPEVDSSSTTSGLNDSEITNDGSDPTIPESGETSGIDLSSKIEDWKTCDPTIKSPCLSENFTCCLGVIDVPIEKFTCRAKGFCHTDENEDSAQI